MKPVRRMPMRAPHCTLFALIAAAFTLSVLLVSCAESGPPKPQKGTPEFAWLAAKETYAAGDYVKTIEHLEKVASSTHEKAVAAGIWNCILTSGVARGYRDLGESFDAGRRQNKQAMTEFRRETTRLQTIADGFAMQLAESFRRIADKIPETVELDFGYPAGTAAIPPEEVRITKGVVPKPQDIELVESLAVKRGVLLATARVVTGKEDTAKTMQLFQSPPVKIPRNDFLVAMANELFDVSKLYSGKMLDRPKRAAVLLDMADTALKSVPETKELKAMKEKMAKFRKELRLS